MIVSREARAAAEKALRDARKFFGIDPAWTIRLEFDACDEDSAARNDINIAYYQATITVDPNKTSDLRDVRRNVGHEVAHVFLASFLRFKADVKTHLEADDLPRALDFGFWIANEQTTRALEQLFMRERPS